MFKLVWQIKMEIFLKVLPTLNMYVGIVVLKYMSQWLTVQHLKLQRQSFDL